MLVSRNFLVNFSDYVKYRYIDQFYSKIKTQDDRENFINNSLYFKLYKSGFYVFKNNPWFGVGNKNYRVETCVAKKNLSIKNIGVKLTLTKFISKCYLSMELLEQ